MTTNVMAPSATKSKITSLPVRGIKPLTRWREEIGVTRATCWRWRCDGLINTIDIYGRQYITQEEEERFLRRAMSGEFHRAPRTPNVKKTGSENK
jgi:hypothetical protein